MALPKFDLGLLQSISDILGDTQKGFTGSEIGRLLGECGITDLLPQYTKRYRIFEALKEKQLADGCGNNVGAFLQHSMNPVRHHDAQEWFEDTRNKLNHVLAFGGYQLGEDGKLVQAEKAKTLTEAQAKASKLKEHLLARKVHPDVLRFCREELLVDNYVHAVFEATKSVAEKIRQMTGLTSDGATLVDEAFTFKSCIPHLAFNTLQSDSEQSEQKGFMNLLKGLFGTFRNTTAHVPKITWNIEEQDALDILSLVSLIHRRLDTAVCARKVCEGKP
jgi:uncharacterized protein (TIGR02391 family)